MGPAMMLGIEVMLIVTPTLTEACLNIECVAIRLDNLFL